MLLIFMGKSASGKSTIEENFEKMISFTSRDPRLSDVHGRDYYFYTRMMIETELRKFKAGEESWIKQIAEYKGHYYGTSQEEVERIQKLPLVVAVMNLEGAKDMKAIMEKEGIETHIIWLEVDENIRIQRIMGRAGDTGETPQQINERLNEDDRNHEKEEADFIFDNNGTPEELLANIHQFLKEREA